MINICENMDSNGRRTYEFKIDDIPVYGYLIPKEMTEKGMAEPHANEKGVYIYVGKDTEQPGVITDAYVGFAEKHREGNTWPDRVSERDEDLKAWKETNWSYTLFFTVEDRIWQADELRFIAYTIAYKVAGVDSNRLIGFIGDYMFSLTSRALFRAYEFVDQVAEILSQLKRS